MTGRTSLQKQKPDTGVENNTVFVAVAMFFNRLKGSGSARKTKPESSYQTAGDSSQKESESKRAAGLDPAVEYRKAIYALKVQFAGKDKPIERTLAELAEKWNPLFEPKAKENLVEDVNSLIRDYVRKTRRSTAFKAPDAERIRNLAAQLSGHESLEKIKKKDVLVKYIEIFIIKVLSQR